MIQELLSQPVLMWLATWLVHSSVLLAAVWAFEKLRPLSAPRLREFLWRTAIALSFLSASVAQNIDHGQGLRTIEIRAPLPVSLPASPASTPAADPRLSAAPGRADPTPRVSKPATISPRFAPPQPATIVLALWSLIAALLLTRLVIAVFVTVARLGRRRPLEQTHPVHRALMTLVARTRLKKPPRLSICTNVSGPLTLPANEICLPDWALSALNDAQIRGVLAHELAHCLRRDGWSLLGLDALRRLFFLQPLLTVATRRLATLAELIADEHAARLTGSHRDVADSLAECAGRVQAFKPQWGVAMAQSQSCFRQRIGRLIQPDRFPGGEPGWPAKGIAFGAALLVAAALPGFTLAAGADDKPYARHATIIEDDDGRLTTLSIEIVRGDNVLTVDGRGHFELDGNESDIVQMAPRARLDIEENANGTIRRVEFDEQRGRIERGFELDGEVVQRGPRESEWLARVLPQVMRLSGYQSEQRVVKLFETGGVTRVLDEIEQLETDYVRRVYLSGVLSRAQLSDREFARIVESLGQIESDYEQRTVVSEVAASQSLSAARIFSLLAALDIESDYELRTAIIALLDTGAFPAQAIPETVMTAAHSMESDYELRTLLEWTAGRVNEHPDIASAYIFATTRIDGDYERRQALDSFARSASPTSAAWRDAIKSAAGIGGEHDRAEALLAIARHMARTEGNVELYSMVARTLTSEHERKRVAAAVGLQDA